MNEYMVAAWILTHDGAEVDVETIAGGDGREFYKVIGVRSESASLILEGPGRKHAASRHAAMVEFVKEITAALAAQPR